MGQQRTRWYFPWTWGGKKPAPVLQQQATGRTPAPTVARRPTTRPSVSQRLSSWTNEADKIVNHLLGYLLAVTGLVAFIDVVGNGKVLSAIPLLFWFWVVVQGLGVDFQILALLRRLPTLYTMNRKVFWANIIFLALLCGMLVIIGAVFVQSIETPDGTIPNAMDALHIPRWGFVWLRSLLSALLLVIFGIDRALELAEHQRWSEQQEEQDGTNGSPQNEQPQPLPPNIITQEQLVTILTNWENNLVMRMQQTIVHEVAAEVRRLTPPAQNQQQLPARETEPIIPVVTITPPTITSEPDARRPDPAQMFKFLQQTAQQDHALVAKDLASKRAAKTAMSEQEASTEQLEEEHTVLTFPASAATKLTQRQQQMYELLKQNPELTVSDIERQTGFARGYISEQRKKLLALIAYQETNTAEQEAFATSTGA